MTFRKVWLKRWERRRSHSGICSRMLSNSSGMVKTSCVDVMVRSGEREGLVKLDWVRV